MPEMSEHPEQPQRDALLSFYADAAEETRLDRKFGPLERARMRELIARFIPPAPAVIYDVGGGPGAHALWLAAQRYAVHLIDAVPLHVEQARQASARAAQPLASTVVGDARRIDSADACADVVILAGPLYHLTQREDRLAALGEARRLLRRGGVLLAVAVERHASAWVGLLRGWLDDPAYLAMVKHELATGEHVRPSGWPKLFTSGHFHTPGELAAEIDAAGFMHRGTYAIQGAAWLDFEMANRWQDEAARERLLEFVRLTERDAVAIGLSPHFLAVAEKPRDVDRTLVRAIASEHLARNDATGWFETLYRRAGGDAAVVPWANLAANPNLVQWLAREQIRGDGRRAIVIGCGLGDDAEELVRRGFAVTAFDVSATAIEWCRRRFPDSPVDYRAADLLDPPAAWRGGFDFVLESYTLQALPQQLRDKATEQVAALVAPGGTLLIICRGRDATDPPGELPWPLTRDELAQFVERHGLTEVSFEDYIEPGEEPIRRFRCVYRRQPTRGVMK